MKTCTKCGKTKPLAEFPARKDRPCGVESACKACRADYFRSRAKREQSKRKHGDGNMNLIAGDNRVSALAAAARVCEVAQSHKRDIVALVDEAGDLILVPLRRCSAMFFDLHRHAIVGTYRPSAKVLDVMDDLKAHMREVRRMAA